MPRSLLTLGPYSFAGLEAPEKILLKTKQRIVIHHLASGSSAMDLLGIDCETVSFRGIFAGNNIAGRIRGLENLRLQRNPIPLTWASRTLRVLIQQLELNYMSDRWVPYQLACYVVDRRNVENSWEEVLISSATQADDIFSILEGTGISPTLDESGAIREIAALNYNVAPFTAMQLTKNFLVTIDRKVADLDIKTAGNQTYGQSPARQAADLVNQLTSAAGKQAALLLARNRLVAISVRAARVNQE